MWIKKLKLVNFQSHRDTEISFVNGFNCITGSSRSGKSSIVRALNFILFDEWSNTFVKNGADYASVIIYLDDGTIIERRKGSINEIILRSAGGESKVFSNFGIEAPPEVKQLLGVYTAAIDTDHVVNINIADQDTPLFLLPESAPTKTKYLNRLTGLHVVDAAIRDVRTERLYLSNVKKNNVASLERLNDSIKKYDALDSIKSNMNETYIQMQKVNQHIERYNTLHSALTRIKEKDGKLTKINRYVTTLSKAKPIVDSLSSKYVESSRLFRLGYVTSMLSTIQSELTNIAGSINDLKKTYNVCPVCLREWK